MDKKNQTLKQNQSPVRKQTSMKKRLYLLLGICLIPLTCMILYLLVLMNSFSERYDSIVENITKANAYNIAFKDDMDYLMYIIAANAERAEELVDTQRPHAMIREARSTFLELYETAESDNAGKSLKRIIKSLNILEDRVEEIEESALVSGSYDENMERLDLNIRVLTELIQEQIQSYIYNQTTHLEQIRVGIRRDVVTAIGLISGGLVVILIIAFMVSGRIMSGITKPIQKLCDMAKQAGQGDFLVRTEETSTYELAVLNNSFNRMVEELGKLVEDIRVEQLNLRAAELKLLQEQINPHFLYNTLDTIMWLAESKDTKQVVKMVSSLSDFFRTSLSKGRDFVTVEEEKKHIRSYLEIQQFRYRDILEYEIHFEPEIYQYKMPKLTLQPLVENALYHGIKNKRGLGHILVFGRKEGEELVFLVQDNGIGMTEERIHQVRQLILGDGERDQESSGFGLFNINERIRLYYGTEYGLKFTSIYQEGTEFEVRIPCVKK